MSLFSRPLLVLDTETTGLQRYRDARPWQLAAVLLDERGVEVDHFDAMMRPDPLPDSRQVAETLAYLHIDRAEIEAAPPVAEVLASWRAWWRRHDCPHPTSFNVGFDAEMLARAGWLPAPRPWASCIMMRAWGIMDADPDCPGHRWESGELKWPRLEEAAAYFQVPLVEPQHRALSDARTAAGIVTAICRRQLAASSV